MQPRLNSDLDPIANIVNSDELSLKSDITYNGIRVIGVTDTKKLVIRDESEFVDLRFWVRYTNQPGFWATKKGVWLDKTTFFEFVLPALNLVKR